MGNIVELHNVSYTYPGAKTPAVKNVSLSVPEGGFVAFVGHNGGGKSTLARLMNGLLDADDGSVTVNGLSVADKKNLYEIRKTLGIVFQNPDNQAVAAVIEDDVAFGPENIGVPSEEIRRRVDDALAAVGMSGYADKTSSRLSGGQKQRVAVAGVLALKPRVIVLDESTAMLDPKGRREVLETVRKLRRDEGIAIILITHFMDEAALADTIYVIDGGEIAMSGGREIFTERAEELEKMNLSAPYASRLSAELKRAGLPLDGRASDADSLIAEIARCKIGAKLRRKKGGASPGEGNGNASPAAGEAAGNAAEREKIVTAHRLSYAYAPGTAFRADALIDVSLDIEDGDFIGVIGHTGSGKSTLIQHLNGLIKMQVPKRRLLKRGAPRPVLTVCGMDLSRKKYDYKALRSLAGMVFQYPEYQLFDETVLKDVGFGPRNLKLSEREVSKRSKRAIEAVGLDFERVKDMSPFELSGGQKRRAALAGVIAMRPELLILDEPTAGLDPKGRDEIMELIRNLRADGVRTVVMISHDMDEIARRCDKVLVLNNGRAEFFLPPSELYRHADALVESGLDIPLVTRAARALRARGLSIADNIYLEEELIAAVKTLAGGGEARKK